MKYISTLLLLGILFFSGNNINAQVPNGGFESWTGGVPDSWVAINMPGYEAITQTSFCHSGSSAVSGKVVSWPGYGLYPPVIYSASTAAVGFSISQKYNSLKGYYAFKPNGGDIISMAVSVCNSTGTPIGAGSMDISAASDNYVPFAVPIEYYTETDVASCYITMSIIGSAENEEYHEGSQMFIDDVELSMDIVTVVNDNLTLNKFELMQNYPNPFNPGTTITYQLPADSRVSLKIFNSLGQEIETLIDENMSAGLHSTFYNMNPLQPSGIYFYQIKAGNFIETKKFMFLK